MIPSFTTSGYLPAGDHLASAQDFVARFSHGPVRARFAEAVSTILAYAETANATAVLFGGSFITARPNPNDIDCVIVFASDALIPSTRPLFATEGIAADLYFASRESPDILASFRAMFATAKNGSDVGTVTVPLLGQATDWSELPPVTPDALGLTLSLYGRRHVVKTALRRKLLITVHGIATTAEWNAEIALFGGLNGWVVYPFIYGIETPAVLMGEAQRRRIVDRFREHLTDACILGSTDTVSVIAHSFGTYVAMNYILGFDDPPTRFDTLILTGAILDTELRLDRLNGRIGHIRNEVAPNDPWAGWAKPINLGRDPLFGHAGTKGFSGRSERLTQPQSDIFDHNNVIKRDVIRSRWMPALNANVGSVDRDRRAGPPARVKP